MSKTAELVIKFNDDKPFIHVMIIPGDTSLSCQEFIRRLRLKCIWRYLIIASFPTVQANSKKFNKTLIINETTQYDIPSNAHITVHKLNFKSYLFISKLDHIKEYIKEQYVDILSSSPFITWFNYVKYDEDPIIIYFFEKENGEWKTFEKRSNSFEEVEKAIYCENMFISLPIALERFFELKEEVN